MNLLKFFFLIATSLAFALCSCVTPPKTATEFRKISVERKGRKLIQISAPLETVVSRMTAHAEKCNSFEHGFRIHRSGAGNDTNYSDLQFFRWENLKSDHPTFIIAAEGRQDINRQPGGFFMFLVDLKRVGQQTQATMYDYNYSWGYYDWAKEYNEVVHGRKGPCQLEEAQEK